MTSLLGVNYALDHTADTKDRDSFHRALDPVYSVAMVDDKKDIPKLQAFGQVNKSTIMVGRVWHPLDGGFHLKPTGKGDENKEFVASPEDLMTEIGQLGDVNTTGFIYVMNEPNTNTDSPTLTRLSTWTSRWLDISIMKRRKSLMWNFGDRQPMIVDDKWQDWCHGHLKRMALYPDLFMVGMHLYGPDSLTEHLTAYVETCKFLGITPIPILATEFGMDTDKGSPENGWRTRLNGKGYAGWIDATIHEELAPFIKSKVLKGLCIFGWNNAPKWKAFDIQEDDAEGNDFKNSVLLIDTKLKESAPIIPIAYPFPADFATRSVERYIRANGVSTFIRLEPTNTPGVMTNGIVLHDGMRCDIILAEDLKPDEVHKDTIITADGTILHGQWLPMKSNINQGWVLDVVVGLEIIPEKTATGETSAVVNAEPILPIPPQETIPPYTPVPPPPPALKKFEWTITFVGTEEENRKALEGINLFVNNAWKVESVEIPA